MSVLAWVDPPAKMTMEKSAYVVPDFGTPVPGEIADLRWAHAIGTNNVHKGMISKALRAWLDENPRYWALVGSFSLHGNSRNATSGWSVNSLHGRDILHAVRDGSVYARSTQELGDMTPSESLQAALDGDNGARESALCLPKLTKDPFGWTEAELSSAVAVARDWLYPTEAIAA